MSSNHIYTSNKTDTLLSMVFNLETTYETSLPIPIITDVNSEYFNEFMSGVSRDLLIQEAYQATARNRRLKTYKIEKNISKAHDLADGVLMELDAHITHNLNMYQTTSNKSYIDAVRTLRRKKSMVLKSQGVKV